MCVEESIRVFTAVGLHVCTDLCVCIGMCMLVSEHVCVYTHVCLCVCVSVPIRECVYCTKVYIVELRKE